MSLDTDLIKLDPDDFSLNGKRRKMNEEKAKIEQIIKVKYPTCLKDLKVGDIVITAELHQIKQIDDRHCIECTDIGEPYPYVKHLGWGQQGILKVIGGVKVKGNSGRKRRTK